MGAASVEMIPDDPEAIVEGLAVTAIVVVVVIAPGNPGVVELAVRQYSGMVVIVTVTESR